MNLSLYIFLTLFFIPSFLYSYVPFTSQAPFADWQDARQQDGCEETASLMAVMWAKNKTISPQQSLNYILSIADFESNRYGHFVDTSTKDTLNRVIMGFFNFNHAEIVNLNTESDLIKILSPGKILIVPTNGRMLNNPNYSGLGPERHNLVVKSYDPFTEEFITNDPGTKKGENYRYPKKVLFSAIRDYPTGIHLPITEIQKSAIVVFK